MTNIAIIPARSGSKRIPQKNILEFNGIPNIVRAINLAFGSKLFERVIVTTDSDEIAKIALSAGAEVPFLRTQELSNDETPTFQVIQDVFHRVPELLKYRNACCIYPVTPLLRIEHLKSANSQLISGNADYVVAGIADRTSAYRHFKINDDGKIHFLFPEFQTTRTQDLPKTFSDAGQFYFGKISAWMNGIPILSDRSEIIEFSSTDLVDIDNSDDWKFAESLISLQNRKDK